eukprot:m.129538 g.129538  ORF g.129538 m.129538 type:complete len:111 (+) comp13891_c0_seq1:1146-1478(+)
MLEQVSIACMRSKFHKQGYSVIVALDHATNMLHQVIGTIGATLSHSSQGFTAFKEIQLSISTIPVTYCHTLTLSTTTTRQMSYKNIIANPNTCTTQQDTERSTTCTSSVV